MAIPEESVRELAALAGIPLLQDDVAATLVAMCGVVVRAVPGADAASITTLSESGPHAVASSDEWGASVDEMQYVEREGPCLDAARGSLAFRVRDTETETRWPSYMPRARAAGVRSMVSVPTLTETKTTGALNVYSRSPDTFGPEEVTVAEIVAGHVSLTSQVAAALFHHKGLAGQLQEAMVSRATIEQAKGVLMAQSGVDADAAIEMLKSASQRENRKLRDIAADLVARQSAPS